MTRSATFIGRFPLEIRREVYKCLCPVWTKPSEYCSLRLTCRQIHQEYDAESVKVTNDYYETVEKDYGAKITKPQTFNDIKNVVMVVPSPLTLEMDSERHLKLLIQIVQWHMNKVKISFEHITGQNSADSVATIAAYAGSIAHFIEIKRSALKIFTLNSDKPLLGLQALYIILKKLESIGIVHITNSLDTVMWGRHTRSRFQRK